MSAFALWACAPETAIEGAGLDDSAEVYESDAGVLTHTELALVPDSRCSETTQKRMREVIDATKPMLDAALKKMSDDALVTRWFGKYGAESYRAKLYITFAKMREELNSRELLRCGSSEGCEGATNGQVRRRDYWLKEKTRIYLCPNAWRQPLFHNSTWSKTQILVHELAHLVSWARLPPIGFDRIDDISHEACYGHDCYGANAAYKLARASGRSAVKNADNFGWFAVEAYLGN